MIPVLGVNCEFKHHVTFDDTILIKLFVKEFNGVRLTMGYTATEKNSGGIVFTGETKHCFTDTNLKPLRLQKANPNFYEKFNNLKEKKSLNLPNFMVQCSRFKNNLSKDKI